MERRGDSWVRSLALASLLGLPLSACAQERDVGTAALCDPDADVTCVVRELTPEDAVGLAGSLFVRHNAGEFVLERLVRRPLSDLPEISPPLLLAGALVGIEEVAPEVVDRHRAAVPAPTTGGESADYVRTLLDAFAASDVDLIGREVPSPKNEAIQVIEIPNDSGL